MMEQIEKKQKLYLIDGSGFIFRAYHAMPPLTRPDGIPVGAVLGFTNMLVKLLTEMRAHKMAVVFDSSRKNFRHDIYPEYKANRGDTPEDLVPQFSIIREACGAFQVPMIESEGYEADDLIATYAKQAVSEDYDVIIVSSDKDLMQLVSINVVMFDQMKNKMIGIDQVIEKFGVGPDKVIDVQALAGDSSDNVPGVPGIGPKTAALLIQEFGALENLLENAATIKQQKRRESLITYADQARLSKKLVTLDDCAPMSQAISGFDMFDVDHEKVHIFLQTQGFNALISRLGIKAGNQTIDIKPAPTLDTKQDYVSILDADTLNEWCREIRRLGFVSVDCETTSLDAMSAELVGLSLAIAPGKACYIPMGHNYPPQLGDKPLKQLSYDVVFDILGPIFSDPSILKIGQNIKYDMLVLSRYGITILPVDDSMLLSYLTASGRHGLDELVAKHFDHKMIKFSDLVSKKTGATTFAEVPINQATNYAAEDADFTLRLHTALTQELIEKSVVKVYERIERPLIPILVNMEKLGVKVDALCLQNLSRSFSEEIQQLQTKIFQLAGEEFNIGSPKQLGTILFDTLKLTGGKKTKTGAYGTGVDILEGLAHEGHEIATRILEWRQFSKLKSTYTDSLIQQINPKTGRVHTSYAMAVTSTGRLSSSDPNLQNIPIRTVEGRKIRGAFVAERGYKFVSFDYSQIELRLLAHVAGIESLVEAFKAGADIHALTASQVFGVAVADITPELRRRAKAINFGIIYGISAYGLAQQLDIPQRDAAAYMQAYNSQYPGISAYMDDVKAFARHNGYVETLFGRKCYVPMILSKNGPQRAFAERQAINAPLQGGAADIIKLAMIDVVAALTLSGLDARLLLQVHDELIFEIQEDDLIPAKLIIQDAMEKVVKLDVPLIVDVGVGSNWSEAH